MDNRINTLGSIAEQRLTFENLRKRGRPIKTGIPMLDSYLEGGITPGLYVLGAGPGQGKSTLALQLGEYISREEQVSVLYFSLEMTAERIAAKTMAMDSFRAARNAGFPVNGFSGGQAAKEHFFTASELFNQEKLDAMPEEKRLQIQEAQQRVSENKNLYIIESSLCAREIRETVEEFLANQPEKKPFVIVDYLQILPPDPKLRGSLTDKQLVDLNLKTLREMVLQEIPILVISSLKRGNYSGNVSSMRMDSFKETGGIEYSADFLLGLQFSACHNPGGCNPDEEKVKYPRDVEIMLLKQRYGPVDVAVPLWYYAEFDYMEQKPDPQSETAERTAESAEPVPEAKPGGDVPAPENPEPRQEMPAGKPLKKRRNRKKSVETACINNTKIAYEIRGGHWKSGKPKRINVAGRGENPVYTEFTLEGELTCFDCDVADAVYSLHRNGQKEFLLRHVLQALTGDENQTLTDEKKTELQQSLKRLTEARITIDCTEQLDQKTELKVEDKIIFEGNFLGLTQKDVGKKQKRYCFADSDGACAMPLYRYGEETGQMITFPKRLLSLRPGEGRKLPDTAENIMIKRYLIRRMEVIRKGKSSAVHLRKVNYYNNRMGEDSGMLATMGLNREEYDSARWQDKLRRTHKTVVHMLDGFRRHGYISEYRENPDTGAELSGTVKNPFALDLEP